MTAGIADPDVPARTITVDINVAAFQRSLAIRGGEDVHALVVTREGAILARSWGEPDGVSWPEIQSVASRMANAQRTVEP